MRLLSLSACLLGVLLPVSVALADEAPVTLEISITDHKFVPETLTAPAGKKLILAVTNKDTTAEEFDSDSLKREKLIPAGKTVPIAVGPLKAGSYPFAGEYHGDSAKGVLTVQ